MHACTVMEDRQECPCNVTVRTDGYLHNGHRGDLVLSAFVSQMPLKTHIRQSVKLEDFIQGKTIVQIPKGWFNISMVGGGNVNMKYERDTLLLIPLGNQSDSVCAFSKECFAGKDDDYLVVEGALDKQFCSIDINLKNQNGKDIDASLKITGNVDGINIMSLAPHSGEFMYLIPHNGSGKYSVRVPRQRDNSLTLNIEIDGLMKDVIPLGILMDELGYSWGTLSLDDFKLTLEFNNIDMTVSVCDWGIEKITI